MSGLRAQLSLKGEEWRGYPRPFTTRERQKARRELPPGWLRPEHIVSPLSCYPDRVPTLSDIQDKLRRPLELELAQGCQNRAVAGGMEKLLDHFARPFPKVREALRGYGEMETQARQGAVQAALTLLAPSSRPVPRPPSRVENRPALLPETDTAPLPPETELGKVNLGPGAGKKFTALGRIPCATCCTTIRAATRTAALCPLWPRSKTGRR